MKTERIHKELPQSDLLFKNLYSSYYKSMAIYAYSILGVKSSGNDVVQDVFLTLWEKREQLDKIDNIKGYLFKAVKFKALDFLRAQQRQTQKQVTVEKEFYPQKMYYETSLETAEFEAKIQGYLKDLHPNYRQAIMLSRFSGLTNDQIAEVMNVSKKTVENHLFRGLSLLKKQLSKNISE